MVRNVVPEDVRCIFPRQPEPLGLGHAVLCAEAAIGREPFVVLLADGLMRGNLLTRQLVEAYERHLGTIHSVMEVLPEETQEYGIVELGIDGSVAGLVEKPATGLNLYALGPSGATYWSPRSLTFYLPGRLARAERFSWQTRSTPAQGKPKFGPCRSAATITTAARKRAIWKQRWILCSCILSSQTHFLPFSGDD